MYYIIYYFISQMFFIGRSQRIEVKVQQGTILGIQESTIFDEKLFYAFYGVPYAKVPVGRYRFKDPSPPVKWKRPYDARTENRGACAQTHIVHKNTIYGNEDCLNLNIYTPSLPNGRFDNLKPVIVWIHGYAFSSSFSHIYGADFLIENDVMFISVTYRIGAFGFVKLNDADSNANMGLKDIAVALKWIRKNVKQFGGDKNRITMMGSSSAATYIALLMTTKFKKLFSKAIMQSGSLFSPSIFQSDHQLERKRLIRSLEGFNLLNASTKEIALLSQKIYTKKEIIDFQRPVVPFSSVVEKKSNLSIITNKSVKIYKGLKKIDFDIPIMIGYNSQESITELIPFIHNPRYLRKFDSGFKFMVSFVDGCRFNSTSPTYRQVAAKIKDRYFNGSLNENSLENYLQYASDVRVYPIYKFIRAHTITGREIYVYKFNYIGKLNAMRANSIAGAGVKIKGAAEGDETCYILKCEPLWESYVRIKRDLSNRDRTFIKDIAAIWANFAKYGDPTRDTNITWPPMTEEGDNLFVFGKENKLRRSEAELNMYSFWNDIYDRYYSLKRCNNGHDEL